LIPSKKEVFRTWVLEKKEGIEFNTIKEKGKRALDRVKKR